MDKFEAFPTGKKRKEIVEQTVKKAVHFKDSAEIEIIDFERYTWIDSPLEGSGMVGQGLDFGSSFKDVLPKREISLKNYIETILQKRKGRAIGVEFGGVGLRLFNGFTPGFFAKSISVTLADHRRWKLRLSELKERDRKIHHKVLEGNIFDLKTYESLNQYLDNKKVDLIIERMGQGLEFVPTEPYTVSKILQIWYDLLREGGVMFVQTPVVFNNLLEAWVIKIKNEFKGVIEIEYQKGKKDNDAYIPCSAFRLHKLPRAPNELPFLDSRTVTKIPKAN